MTKCQKTRTERRSGHKGVRKYCLQSVVTGSPSWHLGEKVRVKEHRAANPSNPKAQPINIELAAEPRD